MAHSAGAVDRANLWSSDGTQGTRGNFNAGQQQQQQLEMSLRNDDVEEEVRRGDDAEEEVRRGDDAEEEVRRGDGAEEEREMDHVAVDESTRQDKVLTAAEELDSASYSPSSSSLNNDSTAATAGSAPEASINASSLSACEVPDAGVATNEAATIETPPHEHASQAQLTTLQADGLAPVDSAQHHDDDDREEVPDAVVAAATTDAEIDAGVAQGTADDVDVAAAATTRNHDDSSSAVAFDDDNVGEGDQSCEHAVAAAADAPAGDEVTSAVSPTSHETDSNHILDSSVQEASQHHAAAGAAVDTTSNDAESPRPAIVAGSSAGEIVAGSSAGEAQLSSE